MLLFFFSAIGPALPEPAPGSCASCGEAMPPVSATGHVCKPRWTPPPTGTNVQDLGRSNTPSKGTAPL